jgi:hypothetical protein
MRTTTSVLFPLIAHTMPRCSFASTQSPLASAPVYVLGFLDKMSRLH